MAIFKLFVSIATHLHQHPEQLTSTTLDEIAAVYRDYAYIGNRQSLRKEVLLQAEHLRSKLSVHRQQKDEWRLPNSSNKEDWASWWYAKRRWETNSGLFPDFVLGWVQDMAFGNGALLELKDSRGAGIASFNSTLPTAKKPLNKLSNLVKDAVHRYDLPWSTESTYPDDRDCFYLVRTCSTKTDQARLSLVQGTFFETIPMKELLTEMWKQLLSDAGVSGDKSQEIIKDLRNLDRDSVAITRRIDKASIKPRFRIMAEVEADGNPHQYAEIPAQTFNLILKSPVDKGVDPAPQIQKWFAETSIPTDDFQEEHFIAHIDEQPLPLRWCLIQHRRNGLHLIIQMKLQE